MRGCALVVFAKAPLPGLAKTRLIPALGADGAAALAQRMLEHAAQVGVDAGMDSLEICAAPDASHPSFARLAGLHGLNLAVQGEGDLGQRMHRAFERVLAQHDHALLIGTDAPALDAEVLARARAALGHHDAVFVPALDGGYALVGLRAPQRTLFNVMRWGTSTVMARTRERLQAAGLRWAELPALADVDEPADLVHLPEGWLA